MTAESALDKLERLREWLQAHPDATVMSASIDWNPFPMLILSEAYFRGHFAGEIARTTKHPQSIRLQIDRGSISFVTFAPTDDEPLAVRL
jgi:hypothetical protein